MLTLQTSVIINEREIDKSDKAFIELIISRANTSEPFDSREKTFNAAATSICDSFGLSRQRALTKTVAISRVSLTAFRRLHIRDGKDARSLRWLLPPGKNRSPDSNGAFCPLDRKYWPYGTC